MMKSVSIAGMLIAPAAARRAPSATDNDRLLVDKTCPDLRSALKLEDLQNRPVKDKNGGDINIDSSLAFNKKVKVKINECNLWVRLRCTKPGVWKMVERSKPKFQKCKEDAFQPNRPEGRVAYITDVEGGLFWFKECIKDHAFLRIKDVGRDDSVLEFTQDAGPNDRFVYGGDVTSNNYHENMRLIKMMLEFKEKEPERVRFVLGNRDLRIKPNLMRKHNGEMQIEVTNTEVFVKEQMMRQMPNLVRRSVEDVQILEDAEKSYEEIVKFKDAQKEMKEYLLDYIDVAEHVVIINDTAFVHGAIVKKVLPKKYLEDNKEICQENRDDEKPGRHLSGKPENLDDEDSFTFQGDTPQQWAEHTNDKKYGYPKKNQNQGFFENYNKSSQIDMGDDAKWNDPCVVSFLKLGGIRRVITGHKPQYDIPSFAQDQENGFEVLVADTNYAAEKDTKQQRGRTQQQVMLQTTGKSDHNDVAVMELRVKGTFNLRKDRQEESWKQVSENQNYVIDPKDPLVGTIRKHSWKGKCEDWWVLAKVGEKYLYSRIHPNPKLAKQGYRGPLQQLVHSVQETECQ